MDYTLLAGEFLGKMHKLQKAAPQKYIRDSLQGEMFVLHYIAHHDEVLPGNIGNAMDISSARVAAALNSLEKKGLITRQMDKNDRRKILVRLTQEGNDLAQKYMGFVIGVTARLLELLGEGDAKEYVRITGRLAELAPKCAESCNAHFSKVHGMCGVVPD